MGNLNAIRLCVRNLVRPALLTLCVASAYICANAAQITPTAITQRAANAGFQVLAPSPAWRGSSVRLMALSNGDALVIRCKSSGYDCFAKPTAKFELSLLSDGRTVQSKESVSSILLGNAEILEGTTVLGVTVSLDVHDLFVRLPSGRELALSDRYDRMRDPGCIGGLAPKQFSIGDRHYALFHTRRTFLELVSDERCDLGELPRRIKTRIEQVEPDIEFAYERGDGTVFFPLPGGYVMSIGDHASADLARAGDFYLSDLTDREPGWRTMPWLTGIEAQKPIDYEAVFQRAMMAFERENDGVRK